MSSDAKTLRLFNPDLDDAALDAFVVYQRTLLAALKRATGDWAGRAAFAHAEALKASALDSVRQARLRSVVEEFCGKRWAARVLRERIELAKNTLSSKPDAAKERRVVEKGPAELARVEDFADFIARIGEKTFALLGAREDELLSLHEQLARAQGNGHLHIN